MKEITASQLKGRCLRVLDEVAETGEPVVITKHGRPIARLEAFPGPSELRGSARVHLSDEELAHASMGGWEVDRR
jgi:antitoxin (DNA-binding transcriptional repressor) of toxin-antitoxin stability system